MTRERAYLSPHQPSRRLQTQTSLHFSWGSLPLGLQPVPSGSLFPSLGSRPGTRSSMQFAPAVLIEILAFARRPGSSLCPADHAIALLREGEQLRQMRLLWTVWKLRLPKRLHVFLLEPSTFGNNPSTLRPKLAKAFTQLGRAHCPNLLQTL